MSGAPSTLGALHGAAALFLGALAALVIQLAPLGLRATDAPAPDLFYCVLAFFALRRPDVAGPITIFALALFHDFLTGGPVGAGALALLLTCEALKLRVAVSDAAGLPRSVWRDWAAAAAGAAAMLIGQWALMLLAFAGPPPLLDLLPRWLLTAGAFPFVAALMRYVLRVRGRVLRRSS